MLATIQRFAAHYLPISVLLIVEQKCVIYMHDQYEKYLK
jgi:hypothetical protein